MANSNSTFPSRQETVTNQTIPIESVGHPTTALRPGGGTTTSDRCGIDGRFPKVTISNLEAFLSFSEPKEKGGGLVTTIRR